MTDEELDQKMREKGMVSLAEALDTDPKKNFFCSHTACTNLEGYRWWLEKEHEKFMRMRLKYEIGEKEHDEMYEWVFCWSAALKVALVNFNKATINERR